MEVVDDDWGFDEVIAAERAPAVALAPPQARVARSERSRCAITVAGAVLVVELVWVGALAELLIWVAR